MMTVFFRETAAGQLSRAVLGRRAYSYQEERADFVVPSNQSRGTSVSSETDGDSRAAVGWYGDLDPESPYNWSKGERLYVVFVIALYTFTVYLGSAVYTASIP
jgi:DHA1 family multidrug resistance protein-like MFS transporter